MMSNALRSDYVTHIHPPSCTLLRMSPQLCLDAQILPWAIGTTKVLLGEPCHGVMHNHPQPSTLPSVAGPGAAHWGSIKVFGVLGIRLHAHLEMFLPQDVCSPGSGCAQNKLIVTCSANSTLCNNTFPEWFCKCSSYFHEPSAMQHRTSALSNSIAKTLSGFVGHRNCLKILK